MPAAVDLLLVLLRAAVAGLLIERAGLPAGGPVHLLLVLLRSAVAGLLIERAGLPARGPPPSTCCSFCWVASEAMGSVLISCPIPCE